MRSRKAKSASGDALNKLWGIGAAHALYHESGRWYHRLRRFPGVLLDKQGYVLFQTKEDFESTKGLQIRKDVHCPKGISRLSNYIKILSQDSTEVDSGTAALNRAVKEYIAGVRPWREVKRDWFAMTADGTLYPAKYLWALATKKAPNTFNSREARRALAQRGLTLISQRQLGSQALEEFPDRVSRALQLSDDELRSKIVARVSNIPGIRVVSIKHFQRNEYVAAAVLRRAKGKCETCRNSAPFIGVATGQPYLEVHHRKRLADGGEDSLENAIAVCPNCHRRAHFG